ncbi:MAG: ABC transporter substrate-binding protein [Carbonactinosporaceae bacterium]
MVTFRRATALALSAGLVLGAAGCAEQQGDSPGGGDDTGPIKIGAVLDITGAGASLGVPERNTLRMLAKEVNAKGGVDGREIELIIEDDQSTEDGAAKAVNKLVSQEHVDIVLGGTRSGPSLAMRPVAEQSKVPMISLAANQLIVDDATWVFKTAQNDRVVIEKMIAYMASEGYTTLGLARDATAFGEGVAEMFDEIGKAEGVKVVRTVKFAPDATDFTAQMVNLRDARADINVIWGIPPAVALAQKAYRQLGIDAPVMQSHGIGNQVFLDTAGASADGLVAPIGRLLVADQLAESDPQKQVLLDFISRYRQEFGEPPSTFAGHAYDAFHMAVGAFEAVGTDQQKVRDHLERVDNFIGITGTFHMSAADHSGLGSDALVLVTVENGEWKLLPVQPTL